MIISELAPIKPNEAGWTDRQAGEKWYCIGLVFIEVGLEQAFVT